ncbi:helix-turn-helix domain-containing protein [Rothia nasimurium]|uniref:Helix-turn-helix domain-containing protein n=1 Tax=Rothia nasimurium TaxID=85336 RepID=A0A4Y9F192_9MICC|nr:helix-turn-helix domain-containing protein [Rothia nasimurium]MBF0809381.1 helix-turn-helix domain-containing protein [Rothia nasimurium]TFU19585.1 helix-turn-helix domain-containing protein [Rothia nasimurium]
MGAVKPVQRRFTAREAAERLGVTTRTVQRLMAEPRDKYLARANHKREQAAELRAQGLSVRQIAEKMGVSKSAAGRYVQEYEKSNS